MRFFVLLTKLLIWHRLVVLSRWCQGSSYSPQSLVSWLNFLAKSFDVALSSNKRSLYPANSFYSLVVVKEEAGKEHGCLENFSPPEFDCVLCSLLFQRHKQPLILTQVDMLIVLLRFPKLCWSIKRENVMSFWNDHRLWLMIDWMKRRGGKILQQFRPFFSWSLTQSWHSFIQSLSQ